VVVVIGAVRGWIRPLAASVLSGLTWTALTTWRATSAEVSGASLAALWPVVAIPAALVGSAIVVTAANLIGRRPRP
jgi:hypothetical protein